MMGMKKNMTPSSSPRQPNSGEYPLTIEFKILIERVKRIEETFSKNMALLERNLSITESKTNALMGEYCVRSKSGLRDLSNGRQELSSLLNHSPSKSQNNFSRKVNNLRIVPDLSREASSTTFKKIHSEPKYAEKNGEKVFLNFTRNTESELENGRIKTEETDDNHIQ